MPKLKKAEFTAKNETGAVDTILIDIEIRANGIFYAHIPEKLRVSFDEDRIEARSRPRKGFFVTNAATFGEIEQRIRKAHNDFMKPTVAEEAVIRYNIESHVSFAMDAEGRIFPNAGYPGAEWGRDRSKTYGDHDACHSAPGGYSLTIGARALIKRTTTHGKESAVEYRSYYKDDDHHGHDNPAQLLNSWTAVGLPDEAREIPYSDEAAMFFFNLLKGMAELNRRVQEFTNTPEKLALTISKSSGILMLPNQGE